MNIIQRGLLYIASTMGSMTAFEEAMDMSPGVKSDSGVTVSPMTAMQQSTVHGCVKVLAEAIGSLPLQFFAQQDDGTASRVRDYELQHLFSIAPNDYQTPIDMVDTIVSQMCLRGKSYYQIIRDGSGTVLALEKLNPDKMEVVRLEDGTVAFLYDNKVPLPRDQVWYTCEFLGLSPITLMKNSIGMAIALEKHGSKFFENGARPAGVLKHPMKLDQDAMARMRSQWNKIYQGVENASKIAILQEGMDYVPLTMSAEDAQFLENRRFQKEEIASIYRVPMHMLNSLERATFSNIEQQDLGFVKHTIRPRLTRIEQSITRDLVPKKDQGKIFARYNLDAILRGAFKDQMQGLQIGILSGQLSPNEARKIRDMPPYDGGETFIVPMNMQPPGGDNGKDGTKDS